MGAVHILPGRHQPPHDDHVALIRSALSRVVPSTLYVGLIVSPPPEGDPVDAMEAEARRQNEPPRCPFTFDQRRRLVEAAMFDCLLPEESALVRVIPLPRPEVSWTLVEAMFPEERVWIVPDVGEAFDDMKATYFRAKGDRVIRLALRTRTDGRRVRALIENDDPELSEHVPPGVARLVREMKEQA
jgi:nicotinamide mononucleotide adenylyltransferase